MYFSFPTSCQTQQWCWLYWKSHFLARQSEGLILEPKDLLWGFLADRSSGRQQEEAGQSSDVHMAASHIPSYFHGFIYYQTDAINTRLNHSVSTVLFYFTCPHTPLSIEPQATSPQRIHYSTTNILTCIHISCIWTDGTINWPRRCIKKLIFFQIISLAIKPILRTKFCTHLSFLPKLLFL